MDIDRIIVGLHARSAERKRKMRANAEAWCAASADRHIEEAGAANDAAAWRRLADPAPKTVARQTEG